MKRSGLFAAEIALILCASTPGYATVTLSQWAPLSASRMSTFGENYTEREIHSGLQSLPDFGVFDYLAYTVQGNTVFLYGKVLNPNLRAGAAMIAETTLGIRHVINKITLLQDSPSDNRIRIDVLSAIYSDPSLRRYALAGSGGTIHIVVEGGKVTLEGEVALRSDARRIVEWVSTVPSVLSISNRLVIHD